MDRGAVLDEDVVDVDVAWLELEVACLFGCWVGWGCCCWRMAEKKVERKKGRWEDILFEALWDRGLRKEERISAPRQERMRRCSASDRCRGVRQRH